MSFSITESDVWPRLHRKIEAEMSTRVDGLRTVMPDRLVHQQGYIEALQWVLDEARPKPPRRTETAEDES